MICSIKALSLPKNPVPHGSPVIVLYRKSGKNQISDADCQKRISDLHLQCPQKT